MKNTSEIIWFVYMVSCADGSIYTGITTNLKRRINQHNSTKGGAKYTRGRQPVALVYSEEFANRSLASKQENILKKLTAAQKLSLIQTKPVDVTS